MDWSEWRHGLYWHWGAQGIYRGREGVKCFWYWGEESRLKVRALNWEKMSPEVDEKGWGGIAGEGVQNACGPEEPPWTRGKGAESSGEESRKKAERSTSILSPCGVLGIQSALSPAWVSKGREGPPSFARETLPEHIVGRPALLRALPPFQALWGGKKGTQVSWFQENQCGVNKKLPRATHPVHGWSWMQGFLDTQPYSFYQVTPR